MNKSESIKSLAEALALAQGAIKPAAKDATNPHFKNRYASLGAVWEAVRGPLANNGLSVVQFCETTEYGVGLTTIIAHKSGEWMSSTFALPPQSATAQGYGGAISYMRRYALAALLGVVADDDDDVEPAARPQASKPTAAPKTAAPREDMSGIAERWAKLANRAVAMGVTVPTVDPAISREEWTQAGRALLAAVQAAEAEAQQGLSGRKA